LNSGNNEIDKSKEANNITIFGSIVNLILTIFKLVAGIIGKSTAMVADAIHSLSDFGTDLVVILSLYWANKPKDKTHDYGHGKFETLGTVIIGVTLFFVGIGIGWESVKKIVGFFFYNKEIEKPEIITIIAAIVSIFSKEWLYQITKRTGKKINSQALIANAWHHRTDSFSSIGTLIGISLAIFLGDSFRFFDPLAGIVVSLLILKVAIDITLTNTNELLECSLSDADENKIIDIVNSIQGATDPHNLKTRKIGNNVSIDIHIRVDGEKKIYEGHNIATDIEKLLRKNFGNDTFISIHIEPTK